MTRNLLKQYESYTFRTCYAHLRFCQEVRATESRFTFHNENSNSSLQKHSREKYGSTA